MERVRQVFDMFIVEPPRKPWHEWVTPLLLSTALVGIALLFALIQRCSTQSTW
jgi:hypothetical protein